MSNKSEGYILMVDDIPCGFFTSSLIADIEYSKTRREIPSKAEVSLLRIPTNKRSVGLIRRGELVRKEKGKLICPQP